MAMKGKTLSAVTVAALLVLVGIASHPAATAAQVQAIAVTSTADSGPGTLREALERAAPGATITFDPTVFPPDDPAAISLLSGLAELTQGQITIDGSNAGVVLDGSQLPRENIDGLVIASSHNVIRGLQILRFPEHGLTIHHGAQDNTIGGDRTAGAGPTGQGNVISGNHMEGVHIEGVGTDHNLVIGNFIGTDATATSAVGNVYGVAIVHGAQHNHIGGATAGERNIISGNAEDGVFIHYTATMYNTVSGNYIGTNASGTAALPNGNFGVNLGPGTQGNLIGGATAAEGNVISGNGAGGVNVAGSEVRDNTIRANFIGVDVHGSQPLPNSTGVFIGGGASHNTVRGNVISGNRQGVTIADSGTMSNTVSGNLIGTNAAGDAAVGNEIDGVWIGVGAHHNLVGGSAPEDRNIISGNENNGAVIDASAHNIISGNYIGTDATGKAPLGNAGIGVVLAWGAQHNLVGGATPEERNIISGNSNVGVSIANSDTMSNTVSGNHIGTDVTGTVAIGNAQIGVHINDGAQYNVIGGAGPEEGNLISGNGESGVTIGHSATMWNVVTNNHIGTDSGGTMALGNVGDGVDVNTGAGLNTIGPGNIIAHNGESGVRVHGADTLGNTITANSIYDNGGLGIDNSEGANAELSPPAVTYVSTHIIRGTAPPHAVVEVFSDDADEGQILEGTTTADEHGTYVFRRPGGGFGAANITAIATDANGNTSEFSDPQSARAQVVTRPLPGILSPTEISVEPKVVGTNLGLALFCVLFFGLTSNVFNSILKDYRDELLGVFGRLVPAFLGRLVGTVGSSLRGITARGRGMLLLTWLIILLVTSLVESFLDPEVTVLSPDRVGIVLTLFISAMAVGGLELGSDLYAHRRWGPGVSVESRVQWVGVGIAIACVVLSRALDFRPGYIYGIMGAMYLMPELTGISTLGKRAALVLLTTLAGGLILWIATAFLPAALAELEPLFLTIFLISLQGVFFALLPLTLTDGGHIWSWRRSAWFVFFSVVLFCFYHFLLNPNASDVQALQQNGVQTLLILIVIFGLATLMLWLLFPFRLSRGRARDA